MLSRQVSKSSTESQDLAREREVLLDKLRAAEQVLCSVPPSHLPHIPSICMVQRLPPSHLVCLAALCICICSVSLLHVQCMSCHCWCTCCGPVTPQHLASGCRSSHIYTRTTAMHSLGNTQCHVAQPQPLPRYTCNAKEHSTHHCCSVR